MARRGEMKQTKEDEIVKAVKKEFAEKWNSGVITESINTAVARISIRLAGERIAKKIKGMWINHPATKEHKGHNACILEVEKWLGKDEEEMTTPREECH